MTTLLPNAKQQFLSAAGVPLAGGSVYFYIPSTTTFKTTWQDSSQLAANTNPVILDAAGEAVIFGFGSYRQVVFDSLGNQIWDQLTSSTDAGGIYSGGTSTGTAANQIIATTIPAGFSLIYGNQLTFVAGFTSTGPTTLNVNGTGAKAITKPSSAGPVALTGGDIVVGNVVDLFYDGTRYQMLTASANVPLLNALGGLTLSNDAGSPNTILDVSAGSCADSTNAVVITLGAFTKSTAGSWAAGTGGNGMGQGLTIANSIWYHVFAFTGTTGADVYFDTSVTAANKPVGATLFRRIGSFKTDGSAHILAFVQNGDEFLMSAVTAELNTGVAGVTPTLLTLTSVPPGVKVNALYRALCNNVASWAVLFNSPDETAVVANATSGNSSLSGPASGPTAGQFNTRTNTSAQIRYVANTASTVITIASYGWLDTRGK